MKARPLSVWAASAPSGIRRDNEVVNDDRSIVDDAHGLWLVGDASGPEYGGYHAPFGAGPGIATLVATFASAEGATIDRLGAAFRSAHTVMKGLGEQHEHARKGQPGLPAALAAADAVRPAVWDSWRGRSFAHFTASVTACAFGDDALVIAQIGTCRAYGSDGSSARLLVPEAVAMLGVGDDQATLVAVEPQVAIVLCTDGIHKERANLRDLFEARSREDVQRLVDRAASEGHDDATAVVLRF